MKSNNPTSPEEILSSLSIAVASVYEGLLNGSQKVQDYFESQQHDINAPLAANIARYHAKKHAASQRRLNSPYWLEEVGNNGIAIRQDAFHIKVLKGKDGEPPTATKTTKSQNFYSQSQVTPKFPQINWTKNWTSKDWEEFIASTSRVNLILCWEVDYSYSISRVQLMCPRQSGKYGQGVNVFWKRPVAHPILGIMGLPTVNDQEDAEDLKIYFEDAEEEK
jgi:hypothetical protein